jgi:hypothetical protein
MTGFYGPPQRHDSGLGWLLGIACAIGFVWGCLACAVIVSLWGAA